MLRFWNWIIRKKEEPSIHYYAFKNDIESVSRLLRKGTSINVRNGICNTLLHVCVKKGHREMAKFLIENGIDVNAKNVLNESALHFAVKRGLYDIVQLLVLNGANLEIINGRGNTPLCEAILQNDIRIVEYLLANKANINVNERGTSPILLAAKNDFNDITKLLIQSGANLNEKDSDGNTVLHNFILFERLDMAMYAINNGVDINAVNSDGDTALHLALTYELDDIVKRLVDRKVPLNVINNRRETPLSISIEKERIDIAKYLIKQGASVVYPDNMPLSVACRENNIEFVKYLITNGVTPHGNIIYRRQPRSLLDFVVEREEMDLLKFLLQNGMGQHEVLGKLIQNDKKQMIEVLLQQRYIDICSFSDEEKQGISNVLARHNNKGIEKLLDGYIKVQHIDSQNRMMTDEDLMEVDEAAVENCDTQFKMEVLLMKAVQKQEIEVVKSLIKKGVNTDGALIDAVSNNRYQTTKILLDNNANKDAYNEINGKSALYIAVENKNNAIVELLTRRKYRLNKINKRDCDASIQNFEYINDGGFEKETPIELARRVNRGKIEDILEEKNREDIVDMLCKGVQHLGGRE